MICCEMGKETDRNLLIHTSSPVKNVQIHVSTLLKDCIKKKMPKIDTLDALEEHKEHEDDYQTNSN